MSDKRLNKKFQARISPRPSTPVIPEGTLNYRRPDQSQFRFSGETCNITAPPK